MPSIFTRSRTTSTPKLNRPTTAPDEFGRITSRTSVSTPPSKKDKKKEKAASRPSDSIEIQVTEGGFLPFYVPPDSEERSKLRRYGYLSYKCEIILGVDEVSRLVDVVSRELTERGFLPTALLFSSQALDISRGRIHKLIDTFLATCPSEAHRAGSPADKAWLDEARFSGPHELAMILRWALARVVHLVNGQESRGILSWESYLRWREDEAAALYPPTYFTTFLAALPSPIRRLLVSLLTLLSRLSAHATSSGLTPPMLASLFGPLLFGLGSPSLPFHHTYGAYLRSSHAAEHLLLAYIRSQPPPLPSRLVDWIRGYPTMLPPPNRLDKARPGAKLKKLNTVKRYVRLYSNDLVKTAASWDLGNSKEWNRVLSSQSGPNKQGSGPRYSDSYRKQMSLPVSEYPETGMPPSPNASLTSSSSVTGENDAAVDPLAPKEDQLRFRTLSDLKWGEFESMGFLGSSDETEKRLEFDLNEGARNPLPEKRTTLTWSDFSQTGFMRNDAPLSATLQFSAPLSQSISTWPSKQHEIHSKLKKAQKALPTFSWDTTPILGGEEAVEESFLDVWCDILYGSGWVGREERVWRDCSWVLVEYKATSQNRPNGPAPADPRTAASLWLYEEFIPNEYKSQLSQPKRKLPIPIPSLTLPFSSKQQQAYTISGSMMGGVNTNMRGGAVGPPGQGLSARLPNARELEFEGLLQREASTKIISLGQHGGVGGGVSGSGGGLLGVGAGARESTLSVSELGHGNVSDLGHGHSEQGSGEYYYTQYVDGSREGSSGGPYYAPSIQGTLNAHVSSSIATATGPAHQQNENLAGMEDGQYQYQYHSTDMHQSPISITTPTPVSPISPRMAADLSIQPASPLVSIPPPQIQTNTATPPTPVPGFFSAMTTPRKSPARFLARVGKSKGSGSGEGGGGDGLVVGDESGGMEKEKSKRSGKDRLKARHSILRKGAKGSEETSIEFETRMIYGVEEGFIDGDDRQLQLLQQQQQQLMGGDGEKTPTQLKFSKTYNHARNISKDDAWIDILVAGSTNGNSPTSGNMAGAGGGPRRRSSDPESTGLSHDPDRVREEIRQVLKGAGPRPAEFSDEEADEEAAKARSGRSFLLSSSSQDRNVIEEYAESEAVTASEDGEEEEEEELDDEAVYGHPESYIIDDNRDHYRQTDFLSGVTKAGRVSIPSATSSSSSPSTSSPSPHGEGISSSTNNNNGQQQTQKPSPSPSPSSLGSSLSKNDPVELYQVRATTDRGNSMSPSPSPSPSPLFVPSSSSTAKLTAGNSGSSSILESKIPRLRPPNLDTIAATTVPSSSTMIPPLVVSSSSPPVPASVPDASFDDDVATAGDTESQSQDDDSAKLIDSADLLSGLVVNPTTPRYVHGAPLHNVVEEEEE